MVSSNLWADIIDSRFGKIFMMISENICAGFSVMTVADFFQLLSVKEKLFFSIFSVKIRIKHLLGC